jgi:hypothetical protein
MSNRAVSTFGYPLEANYRPDSFARGREIDKKGVQINDRLLAHNRELRGGFDNGLLFATLGAISSVATTLRFRGVKS